MGVGGRPDYISYVLQVFTTLSIKIVQYNIIGMLYCLGKEPSLDNDLYLFDYDSYK